MNLFNIKLFSPTQETSITLDESDFVHDKSTGFGMPDILRYSDSTPLQSGIIDRGYKLLPRKLTFKINLRAKTPTEFFDLRQELTEILRPSLSNVSLTLQFTLPDTTIYQISCYCTELDFTPAAGYIQHAEFTFLCPNPVYRKVISPTVTYLYAADFSHTKIITVTGTWKPYIYPFSIRGPVTHPVITNQTTGHKLDINYTIPDNDIVYIDLRSGYKTILLNSVTNLLGYLSYDSDLDNFSLYPNPDAASGNNVLMVTGTGTGANTRIALSYTPTRIAI